MAKDVAPLGLNRKAQAISCSHGLEAIAVGHRMAPAKAGSTPGELNFMLANSVGQEVRPVFLIRWRPKGLRQPCGTFEQARREGARRDSSPPVQLLRRDGHAARRPAFQRRSVSQGARPE